MIKKTLIAFAVTVALASLAQAWPDAIESHTFSKDKTAYLKVEGMDKVYWPYEFKFLEICRIPVYMNIGMYIKVVDCEKKKIELDQVDCKDVIGKGSGDFPCYYGCVKVDVEANFQAELETKFYKVVGEDGKPTGGGVVIDKVDSSVEPDVIDAATKTKVEICVWTWKTDIQKHAHGEKVKVGDVAIRARPAV